MAPIEHVVVLMLENRSFDCMLGWLYRNRPDFDGLTGQEANPWHRDDGTVDWIPVWNDHAITAAAARIPNPDPGELFDDITMQIFGLRPDGTPRMNGFVDNYMRQPTGDVPRQPRAPMHCFTPGQLPVLSTLARQFGVSDRWFASAPCQTWPNRLFVHTGTGGDEVNNDSVPLPFFLPTVFRRLGAHGHSWRVYFHDLPQTAAFADLWLKLPTHFRFFASDFAADAACGALPNYSFIEPRYLASRLLRQVPNDAHPPHNVAYAEQLIADVYNAVRAGPDWDRTLLIITFDEHGGCYDHVPPPAATPTGNTAKGFAFDRYGVRVPAVIVSPYVPAGSVIRPPEHGPPFDHTSILATLRVLFGTGEPLSPRSAAAPDVLTALRLRAPDNQGPDCIRATGARPSRQELRTLHHIGPNAHQRRMLRAGALLPMLAASTAAHTHDAGRRLRRRTRLARCGRGRRA